MFTGIVQAVGVVRSIQQGSAAARLALDAPQLTRPIPPGCSIAVAGVCLTVAAADETRVEFDVIPETLSRSTLGGLKAGARVNLERSLRAGDPLDGHVVQGHVDGIARVGAISTGDDGHVVSLIAKGQLMPFIIPKGSVAIDGVSLTIAGVGTDAFSVALIPTTLAATTLGRLKAGDCVNVETDILARAIVTTMRRLTGTSEHPGLTIESLRENGW
jgi:riboflavin synthase